jgi:hypothetical protein
LRRGLFHRYLVRLLAHVSTVHMAFQNPNMPQASRSYPHAGASQFGKPEGLV